MFDTLLEIILIFSLCPVIVLISLLFEGIDRKLHARLQRRIGPPITQPFYDFFKLFGKERIIPENATASIFTIAPILAVICAILGVLIPFISILFRINFVGDIILVIYLLSMPSLMIMIGGAASGNPFATIGFSRAITMLISYEVPFVLSIGLIALKTGFSVTSYSIISAQEIAGMPLAFSYLSMAFAAAAFLFCIPIAVGVVPFDLSEAKTEIASGSLIEYNGPYLALMKVSKSILAFAMAFLAATLFFNLPTIGSSHLLGPLSDLVANLPIALFIMILTITLPRTLFARAKPKQVLKFYWSIPIMLVIIATIFNIMGL
jgi:NADH-quinone oxidoreductase subunit H